MKTALLLAILVLVAIGTSSAFANGAPYNGGFDGGLTGWTGNNGNISHDPNRGYTGLGSAKFAAACGGACALDSLPVRATGEWSLSVYSYPNETSVCQLRLYVMNEAKTAIIVNLQTDPYYDKNVWFVSNFYALPYSGVYVIRIQPAQTGACDVWFDDIVASGAVVGDTPSGTPTPAPTIVPGATATPTATATPLGGAWGPISQNAARGVVNVGTPTPYFSRSAFDNPVIPINLNGNSDPSGVWNLTMTWRDVSACLPSQLTQVFSDMDVCLAVPFIVIEEMSFAGIDFIPYLTMAVSTLLFVSIVLLLKGR